MKFVLASFLSLFCTSVWAFHHDSLAVEHLENCMVIHNMNASLRIEKHPWKVSLLDSRGTVQFSEEQPPQFLMGDQWESVAGINEIVTGGVEGVELVLSLSSGQKVSARVGKEGPSGFRIMLDPGNAKGVRGWNLLHASEEVYGFGETWNGKFAQRGEVIEIWDHVGTPDECAYMPYYVSTRNYTFFLDYGGRVSFDIGQAHTGQLRYEAATGILNYVIVSGESLATAVKNHLSVTGLPSMPPEWALKPWFWLMGDPAAPGMGIETLRDYHFMEMIRKLDSMDIPVGVTWFEPPWQTARTTFIPNPDFTENISVLIRQIEKAGVKALGWTVPYTTASASNFREAVDKGYLVRNPDVSVSTEEAEVSESSELLGNYYNYIDFYNPGAREWWKAQISRSLDLGLKGFKLDAGQDLQEDALLYGGRIGKDYHNAYALEYNKVFYEALTTKFGNDFLMIPRATWMGSTSYTNFKWPGDLSGTFGNNGLPSSVYSSLSLAISGFPFVSSDIGGFEPQRRTPEDVWIRWAQFGAMLPGMQTMQMPWWFSPEAQDHFRFLTWLHTDLIPYWFSLSVLASNDGTPICRPLVWDYQDDIKTWRIEDQFTVGEFLLVAPILNSEPSREVYLPEGQWIDFWDESIVVNGGQKIRWETKSGLWRFPLYIKRGAILPMEVSNEVSGFGNQNSSGYLTVAIWPEESGTGTFAMEDSESQVEFRITAPGNSTLEIDISESSRDCLLRVHLPDHIPALVDLNELPRLNHYLSADSFYAVNDSGWWFNGERSLLWIRLTGQDNENHLTIKMHK